MTPATVSTAAMYRSRIEEYDLEPGQRIHVIGWVYFAAVLHAVYAESDGYVQTIPAIYLRVEPHDESEDRAA